MEEVMAAAEIADYLGVSRQRVAVLAERADFPAPIAHLSVGRIWRLTAVTACRRTSRNSSHRKVVWRAAPDRRMTQQETARVHLLERRGEPHGRSPRRVPVS
jgi:prophage regulatory protein